MARAAFLYALQEKLLNQIGRDHHIISVDYERLRDDTAGEIRRVCDCLGIAFQAEMLESRFRQNTSFQADQRTRNVFSRLDRVVARLVALLCRAFPIRLMLWLRNRYGGKNTYFINGTFAEIAERYELEPRMLSGAAGSAQEKCSESARKHVK